MTTLTWTFIETSQPGWSLELGLFSQPVNSVSVTQGVGNWQDPEVLLAYGDGGTKFLGYCEVFAGFPSGACTTVGSKADGTGTDYTLSLTLNGIDRLELGAFGATGYTTATFPNAAGTPAGPEPATGLLLAVALIIVAAGAMLKRAVASIDFAADMHHNTRIEEKGTASPIQIAQF